MSSTLHGVVWIDHDEAHILHLGPGHAKAVRIRASDRVGHLHHKAGTPGPGHAAVDRAYLAKIAQALAGTARILVLGPGTTRMEFVSHIREHEPLLAQSLAGVEPMDRRTDGELEDYARRYFRRDDRVTP